MKELEKPGRDPRDDMPKPILRSDVLDMKDLKPGMILKGTVRNVIDFGVFVDIGVHQDGLVHISQICERRIKKPSEVLKEGQKVKAKVLNTNDNKISLSMKALEEEMVDTEPAEDIEQYTSKESFGSSLGSLLAGIKLD